MAAASYLDTLNPEQRQAVEHGVSADGHLGSPLLVIAGAGSGKTNTLAHRVAHLIVNNADPRRILLMTFSRRAASEMARRVERIARKVLGDKAGLMTDALNWAGTFHGIGARLLREYADRIGIDPAFTIHDREDSADLMNLARHDLGLSRTESRFPTKGTCLSIYSRCVNAETDIGPALGQFFPWCSPWADQLKALFAAYVEAKQRQNVLDYDDLLLYWAQMMSDGEIARELGDRFDHVLVDEYQDTNRLQSSILMALKPGGRGLTVVGDDAQSIYSFRAATVRNILEFPNAFSPAADIITLDRNYRSTQPILSRRIFGPNVTRRSVRNSSAFATRRTRLATSSSACWRVGRSARCSNSRPCCSGRRITAARWKWNLPATTFPSSNSAASNFSTARTSRTCWRCCALRKTRVTAWPVFVSCISYPVWDRRPHIAFLNRWGRSRTRCRRSPIFQRRRGRARIGTPSLKPSSNSTPAEPVGRPRSNMRGAGTNRTSNASMRMRPCGR